MYCQVVEVDLIIHDISEDGDHDELVIAEEMIESPTMSLG